MRNAWNWKRAVVASADPSIRGAVDVGGLMFYSDVCAHVWVNRQTSRLALLCLAFASPFACCAFVATLCCVLLLLQQSMLMWYDGARPSDGLPCLSVLYVSRSRHHRCGCRCVSEFPFRARSIDIIRRACTFQARQNKRRLRHRA